MKEEKVVQPQNKPKSGPQWNLNFVVDWLIQNYLTNNLVGKDELSMCLVNRAAYQKFLNYTRYLQITPIQMLFVTSFVDLSSFVNLEILVFNDFMRDRDREAHLVRAFKNYASNYIQQYNNHNWREGINPIQKLINEWRGKYYINTDILYNETPRQYIKNIIKTIDYSYLTEISFKNCSLTDEIISQICQFKNIEVLTLGYVYNLDKDFLYKLTSLENLVDLTIEKSIYKAAWDLNYRFTFPCKVVNTINFQAFSSLTQLTSLTIRGFNYIQDPQLSEISHLINLQHLVVESHNLCILTAVASYNFANLRSITVEGNREGCEGWSFQAEISPNAIESANAANFEIILKGNIEKKTADMHPAYLDRLNDLFPGCEIRFCAI